MNVLHQDALILEHITLGPQVETVVPGKAAEGKTLKQSNHFTSIGPLMTPHVISLFDKLYLQLAIIKNSEPECRIGTITKN